MAAQSTSASGNQVFRLPLIDAQAMPSSTGGYPWSIEGESATVVYIKNVTQQRRQYVWQLNYAGGVYAPGLKTIEAGQTAVIDVRALRDNQVADEHGRVIPLAARRGQVTWSMDGADDLVLIGRAEQADLLHAMSSSYACANCCPASFSDGWCDPASVSGAIGGTTQFRAWQQNEDCYGTLLEPFLRSVGWSSLNTTIATVTTGGLATARNVGSTYIRANYGTQYLWELLEPSNTCYRTSTNPIADALCDVMPTLTIGLVTFAPSTISYSGTADTTLSVVVSASSGVTNTTGTTLEAGIADATGSASFTITPRSQAVNLAAGDSHVYTFNYHLNSSVVSQVKLKGLAIIAPGTGIAVFNNNAKSNELTVNQ